MTGEEDRDLVRQMTEGLTDLAMTGQRAALGALQAEMLALAAMIPGVVPGALAGMAAPPRDEARRREIEAEIEAGFDNMPV
ncbi:hypothetical protein [Xinfangfangia pollutisoli]|uniref:hypothetical protein n=1 Tax=Xinfangfangia pollutisoli TaxID=2865960 RepID=UPI001CD580E4|nr:hypothetical protein [Xinfangfangia pollutisoli]